MTRINANTKKGSAIVSEWNHNKYRHTDIFGAYARPSYNKINSFNAIRERAVSTSGYNGDLTVTGHNSSFYSTIYSYTDSECTHIVNDTYANTYIVTI